MALHGEDKEMRMPSSLGYNNNNNNNHSNNNNNNNNPLENLDQVVLNDEIAAMDSSVRSKVSKPPGGGGTGGGGGIRYRECLKNHAASIGGNVTDGCGEFMPSGEDGTLEALKCAACNCHRNFHRKETNSDSIMLHPLHLPSPPSHPHHHHRVGGGHWQLPSMAAQPVKMAFGGVVGGGGSTTMGTDSSSEELNFNTVAGAGTAPPPPPPFVLSKKRFRTKFSQEQKDKMLEFAEKLGWRIPREDDSEVQKFCAEVGVKRQVFKVWMHNNKNSSSSSSANKKNIINPQEESSS